MNFLQSSIGGDDVLKYHTDHFFSACFFLCVWIPKQVYGEN